MKTKEMDKKLHQGHSVQSTPCQDSQGQMLQPQNSVQQQATQADHMHTQANATQPSFLSSIVKLAVPIALQNLLFSLLNIFDQVMVGALPKDVADYAMSSVLLVNQLVFIFQLLIFSLCNATNIFLTQYNGRNDKKSMPPALGFSFILALAISSLACLFCLLLPQVAVSLFNPSQQILQMGKRFLAVVALSFVPFGITIAVTSALRALKKVKLSLTANLIAIMLNVLLNYGLMFGKLGMPELGLVGAAWGTVISRTVETLIVLVSVCITKPPIVANFKQMTSFKASYVKKYIKTFLPIVANEIFWVLGTSIYLMIFAQLPDSENILAAVNVSQSLDRLLSVTMIGLGVGCSITLGNILGQRDLKKAQSYAMKSIKLALCLGCTMAVLLFSISFFAPQMFVNLTPLSHKYAADLLKIFAIGAIIRTLNFTMLIGIMRAGGDTTFMLVLETITIWLLGVPLALLFGLVLNLKIQLLYIIIFGEELIKLVLSYRRIKKEKWIKILVSDQM